MDDCAMTARICRIHDEADVIPGRICGGQWPCDEHGDVGPSDPRWIRPRDRRVRARPGIELTISREAMRVLDRLMHLYGSRSAAVEHLVLTAAIRGTEGE